jgi:chorismate mutase / prephenate dehydratase
MPRPAPIAALRRQIDRIDDRVLQLLNRRARLAQAIGAAKARNGAQAYAPARETRVLTRLVRANRGPLSAEHVRAVFREVISASRSLEQRLRVAYLGPQATFSHLAAMAQFGAAAEYAPAATIAEVFRDVENARADLGVVPVENSTEGVVAHTLDLLVDSPLGICAEISIPVRHCLLARRGTTLARVKRVIAHPQALPQCRRWLATNLPGVPLGEAASNARAAQMAAREAGTAAVAAAAAAEAYGLEVLADGIQDDAGNTTRFLVLGPADCPEPSGDDKTSLVVSVRDEVGVLAKLLRPFAQHGIDLIKIESRPLRERPWEYYFFLDLRGHRREARVERALAAVARRSLRAKVLGSYPAAPGGTG